MKILVSIREFLIAFLRRLRLQGPLNTVRWLHTVGLAWLTGRISLRFSQVTPNVWVGPQYGKIGRQSLEKAGVTASMNLRAEFDDGEYNLAIGDSSYLPTIDNTAPSMEHLKEGVAFMQNVAANNGVVYVHCGSGVGRSPTVVAAYLIAEGKTLDEAITQIRTARPFIRILPPQIERLKEYERHVRQQSTHDE